MRLVSDSAPPNRLNAVRTLGGKSGKPLTLLSVRRDEPHRKIACRSARVDDEHLVTMEVQHAPCSVSGRPPPLGAPHQPGGERPKGRVRPVLPMRAGEEVLRGEGQPLLWRIAARRPPALIGTRRPRSWASAERSMPSAHRHHLRHDRKLERRDSGVYFQPFSNPRGTTRESPYRLYGRSSRG